MSLDAGIDAKNALEGKQYDSRHQVWETAHQLGSPIYRLRQSLIFRLLPEKGKLLHFLDVGCGTGDYARALLERGHRVDAIDISEAAVREAVQRVPERLQSRFSVRVGDFSLLGQQARYDGIICSEVLEHMQEDETLLKQLHALLLPQGTLILSVPADPSLWSNDDLFSGHVRRYTREDLVAKLEKTGFAIENFWSYGFPILRIYSWFKLRLLRGKSAVWAGRCDGAMGGRLAFRLFAFVVNILASVLDRRLLSTEKGIGFVAQCRKA